MVFKERYKIAELIALIDQKEGRLLEMQAEEQLLRAELVLLTTELLNRGVEDACKRV